MNTYTPRPGSRTAAAVNYLRAHNGEATAIDIAEACDTERKNLPAQFKAALDNGLLEACYLPEGKGYRLRRLAPVEFVAEGSATVTAEPGGRVPEADGDTEAPAGAETYAIPEFLHRRARPPVFAKATPTRTPTGKKSQRVATPPAAAEATEIRPYLGAMPKATAAKPRTPRTPAVDHFSGTVKMVAPPFRIGHYSDGSVRLEGLAPEMIITDGAGELPSSVMLSPEAALQMVRYLGGIE